MSKDKKTISKGWDSTKSLDDTATIWEMGNQICGPNQTLGKDGCALTITTTKYLTQWVEAQLVKECTAATTAKFLFENMLTWFGYPKTLMSYHGTHFLNETISTLIEEFQV